MLSLTSEYALRALIYLTRNEKDWPIPGRTMADRAHIPPKYLSKILGDLVRFGVLSSSPGKNGGFSLKHPARQTKLFEILAPFESIERKHCPFGNKECSDENPCGAHKKWKGVIEAEQSFLQKTSLFEISKESQCTTKNKVKQRAKVRKKSSS